MQNDRLVQDTDARRVLAAGSGMTCHRRPFHRSARDSLTPKSEPTATQKGPRMHDAAAR
jgi:hypothetical protein